MASGNVASLAGHTARPNMAAAEWQARTELAAAHRYAAIKGWTHLIFNHFTMRVPGEPNHFLIKPHELLFEEVTASNLMKLDLDGNPVDTEATVNAAGFTIHTAVLNARPDVNAVCHVHTVAGATVSAMRDGLRFHTQEAAMFYNRVGYHDSEGIADDVGERERISRDIGAHKTLILRNHGLLTCGESMVDALYRMNELTYVTEVQMQVMASGAEVTELPAEVCEQTARQFEKFYGRHKYADRWPAMLRMVERAHPDYAD